MDLQSLNPLNVRLNLISGNLLPLTEDSSFSIPWRIYSIVVWLIALLNTVSMILSFFYIPIETIVRDGVITLVITIEVVFIVTRIEMQKTLIHQLIRKMNDVLKIEDNNMKNIIMKNLKPVMSPFKYYAIFGTISIIIWCGSPMLMIFQRNTFYYVDFKVPGAFSKQPFSSGIFVIGNIISTITNIYLFFKKISVDIYTTHLLALLTSQYQYLALKFVMLFQNSNEQDNTSFPDNLRDSSAVKEIKSLCQQHINIIDTTLTLKKLLSLSILFIYMNNVFRFCFLGVMFGNGSATFSDRILVIMYASGSILQFYILCACFQRLRESTTEVADDAFHEDWYRFNKPIKRTYWFVITASNNINLCLSIMEKFNLSLPAFMAIINQSYSFALILLRV